MSHTLFGLGKQIWKAVDKKTSGKSYERSKFQQFFDSFVCTNGTIKSCQNKETIITIKKTLIVFTILLAS